MKIHACTGALQIDQTKFLFNFESSFGEKALIVNAIGFGVMLLYLSVKILAVFYPILKDRSMIFFKSELNFG